MGDTLKGRNNQRVSQSQMLRSQVGRTLWISGRIQKIHTSDPIPTAARAAIIRGKDVVFLPRKLQDRPMVRHIGWELVLREWEINEDKESFIQRRQNRANRAAGVAVLCFR